MITQEEKMILDLIVTKLDGMDHRLTKMEKCLEKQKSFFAGIMFVVTGIAWALTTIKDWIK